MPVLLRRFFLLMLLMAVPLQGTASAIHALACAPGAGHASAATADHGHSAERSEPGTHDHASHDHGAPHQHPADSGENEHAGHQCCHHFSSAAAPTTRHAGDIDLPVYLSSLTLLETLFFPEQPQRPPRG
jgi:hypothetical protein